jgi:hypothetical protein
MLGMCNKENEPLEPLDAKRKNIRRSHLREKKYKCEKGRILSKR